jgi:hypothetical protein
MKTTLLTVFAFVIGISLSAQKIVQPSAEKANMKAEMPDKKVINESGNNSTLYSPGYYPKAAPGVVETPIGMTLYDLQSNAAVQNRIYAYPDGTIGAVWTTGWTPPATAFADRGTGYNYFDGTSWGEMPTTRIPSETLKNGWPSYAPLGENGEMVISHTGAAGLYLTKRATKGTGTWTSTIIPGTANMTWPRAVTNGNSIHLLVNSGSLYQGMTNALLYFRSDDAGANFTGPTIIPGLDAASFTLNANFTGIGGDAYGWAAPRGDSLAFVVTDGWGGIWAFKSFDDGLTWTKVTAFEFPAGLVQEVVYATHDDFSAVAMDNAGKVHIVAGRMRVSDADLAAAGSSYLPYTDGLIYWNENMPVMDTTLLADLDLMNESGNLIGYMTDYNGNDLIDFPEVASGEWPFGTYYASMSSMPQIVIDDYNNIFVSFSQCREDLVNNGAVPNAQIYRHLFLTSKMASRSEWIEARDLTDDIEHAYDECVFASLSYSMDDRLHLIYQLDPEPGLSVRGDEDPEFLDNYINHLTFPTFVSTKPADVTKDVMVSPNPATEYTNVQVMLNNASKVEVNVYDAMGKLVMNNNFGEQTSGYHTYKVNTASLTSGMYLFTVKIGNNQTSQKVVVK